MTIPRVTNRQKLYTLSIVLMMLIGSTTTLLLVKPARARVVGLQVLYPNGGEEISGTITIKLTIDKKSEKPGNLIYLSYSADGSNGPWHTFDTIDNLTAQSTAQTYTLPWDTSTLPNGTTYRIQAAAVYPANKTAYLTAISAADFTIGHMDTNLPPNPPKPIHPYDNQTDIPVNTTLTWIGGDPDPDDTLTYDVYLGTTNPPPLIYKQNTTTYTPPDPLAFSTTYYWKIVARDNHFAETSSPTWCFTTHLNQPPNEPDTPSPADNTTGVDINTILSWTGGDPDDDPVTYDVYFDTTSTPPLASANQTEATYTPGTLTYNTSYSWQIITWDTHGASTIGPLWTFTTSLPPNQPPAMPSNPNPADDATHVARSLNLSWSSDDPDSGDTVTFDVYFGVMNPPPLLVNNLTIPAYTPGPLAYSTTYYWQIVAWDSHDASTAGPLWTFTSETQNSGGGGGGGSSLPPTAKANGPYLGVVGEPIVFNATGSHDNDEARSSIVQYEWKFFSEDAWRILTAAPSFTYEHAGNYTVTLRVTDDEGQTATDSAVVLVSPASSPLSVMINGPSSGRINTQYDFTLSSTGPEKTGLRFTIDWGDGLSEVIENQSGAEVIVAHSWARAHPFDITVTVSDGVTVASVSKRVFVDALIAGNIGILLDINDDGVYDVFEDAAGVQKEISRNGRGDYLIDVDGNGIPDYLFNINDGSLTVLGSVTSTETQASLGFWWIIGVLLGGIALLVFVVALVGRRKRKTVKQEQAD